MFNLSPEKDKEVDQEQLDNEKIYFDRDVEIVASLMVEKIISLTMTDVNRREIERMIPSFCIKISEDMTTNYLLSQFTNFEKGDELESKVVDSLDYKLGINDLLYDIYSEIPNIWTELKCPKSSSIDQYASSKIKCELKEVIIEDEPVKDNKKVKKKQ